MRRFATSLHALLDAFNAPRVRFALIGTLAIACHRPAASPPDPVAPPSMIVGEFTDDYGGRHSVSPTDWRQRPRNRFHILRWVPGKRYLIARNDSANAADGGMWTRIDWVPLSGMPPYEWAFCFSAYKAPSAAAAEDARVKPETPRTGCNGYPFTRMRRATSDEAR